MITTQRAAWWAIGAIGLTFLLALLLPRGRPATHHPEASSGVSPDPEAATRT